MIIIEVFLMKENISNVETLFTNFNHRLQLKLIFVFSTPYKCGLSSYHDTSRIFRVPYLAGWFCLWTYRLAQLALEVLVLALVVARVGHGGARDLRVGQPRVLPLRRTRIYT